MKVGFIGLGIMGRPMASHLIKGGHEVHLHSRSGVPEELARAGGRARGSPRGVAEAADVEPGLLATLGHLAALPLLQACGRQGMALREQQNGLAPGWQAGGWQIRRDSAA